MKLFRKLILMSAASFAVIPSVSVADILIAPTRVVMEQGERSAELVFINKGGEEAQQATPLARQGAAILKAVVLSA